MGAWAWGGGYSPAMLQRDLLGTSTINLRTLLANGKRYEVPCYQRDYSWTEDQWEDLWADLCEVETTGRQHYMGALVLKEERTDDFRVIDGQQRLATLSVLVVAALHCLRELILAGVDADANEQRLGLLRTAFLGAAHPVTLQTTAKLTLNHANRRFFEGTLLELQTPPSVAALPPTEKPLWNAMVYFRDRLRVWLLEGRDGARLANFIYEVIGPRLLFIQVLVQDDVGAYTVFETLNSRGLELTAGDLVKNYLFSIVHAAGDGGVTQARHGWEAITERIPAREIAEFLRHHVNSTRSMVRQQRVYQAIRAEVTRAPDVFELLRELQRSALLSAALEDSTHPLWEEIPGGRKPVHDLGLYGVLQYRPLAFAVWRRLPGEVLGKVLRYCGIISFRYNAISQRSTNRLEQVYNTVALAVHEGRLTSAEQIRDGLQGIYVTDDEFREAFAKRSIPTGRRARLVRHILLALERHAHGWEDDAEGGSSTVEHVLPDQPAPEWQEDFPEDLHERYVNRLGNYLLLESRLNSRECANRPFADKLRIYRQSRYPSTRDLAEGEWTPEAIERRQAAMARMATAVWRL